MQNLEAELNKKNTKWYFKPIPIIVAVFVVGPFAIPLIIKSPALKKWQKITIVVLIILLTAWAIKLSVNVYGIFMKDMANLQETLR